MGRYSSAANHFLGRGKLYVDRWVSGASTGERYVGNASVYEPQAPEDETQEIYDYGEAETPLLDKQTTRRKMSMKTTLHEFTVQNLALALMGDVSALAQGTGTVTDEDVTAKQGCYMKLAYRNVSSVVVEPAASGDPFTVDEDYAVDAITGRIYIMTTAEGGSIANDAELHVSYSYAADTSQTILAGMSGTIEGSLRFIGDPKRGRTFEMEVWHFTLAPEGGVGLISDEYGNLTLNFEVLADSENHPTEKFYRVIERAAA